MIVEHPIASWHTIWPTTFGYGNRKNIRHHVLKRKNVKKIENRTQSDAYTSHRPHIRKSVTSMLLPVTRFFFRICSIRICRTTALSSVVSLLSGMFRRRLFRSSSESRSGDSLPPQQYTGVPLEPGRVSLGASWGFRTEGLWRLLFRGSSSPEDSEDASPHSLAWRPPGTSTSVASVSRPKRGIGER